MAPTPVRVTCDPGDYLVEPIGPADGGLYTARNAWNGNVRGCDAGGASCDEGWLHNYRVEPDQFTTIEVGTDAYSTPEKALANAVTTTFTLSSRGEVAFSAPDSFHDDNVGGVSLRLTRAFAFSVNSDGDRPDADTSDGICHTGEDNSEGDPECTLRAAIQEANASDEDTVGFSTPGTGTSIIRPGSPLPSITQATIIDATTQPNPGRVVVDGLNAGQGAHGLHVTASATTLKGLTITGFDGNGLLFEPSGNGAITIQEAQITDNCGWGIKSSSLLNIGHVDGVAAGGLTKVNDNGLDTGCRAGGILAYGAGDNAVIAHNLEVIANGGTGILTRGDVPLTNSLNLGKIDGNTGYGI